MCCDKIPDIIRLVDYGGDYHKYEDAVYSLYQETFESKKFFWGSKPVRHKKHPEYKGKPATFWHITSSGTDEVEREPDLRRYETIAWPSFILDYCLNVCNDLLIWKNLRGNKTRILLWCRDIDYIVILEERDTYCIFWTAYPISFTHTRHKLLKEYQQYQATIC